MCLKAPIGVILTDQQKEELPEVNFNQILKVQS